jgi:hypothetical protein
MTDSARIQRPIGRDDLEFYYGGLVLTTARRLANRDWDGLSDRSRRRWLDRARDLLADVLNTRCVAETLPGLAENLRQRI